jgi:hypothetical protein
MDSNERERIKTEGSGAPKEPKPKTSRRGSLDNAAISKGMGGTSKSIVVRRNSDPSEPKQDFVASRRPSMLANSTADSHSQMSRRKDTSHLLKDSGVKLLSADMDLDEPKEKLRLKKMAKKLILKKNDSEMERVPSIFDR